MERYSNNKTTTYKNKIIYKKTSFPDIPYDDSDIYIITTQNDRLDLLAYKYYNDVSLWFVIVRANPILKSNSIIPEEGIQIRIPGNIEEFKLNYNNLNI